jgi:hypothetical protein
MTAGQGMDIERGPGGAGRRRSGVGPGRRPRTGITTAGALVAAASLVVPAGRAVSQADSAFAGIDSIMGYLSYPGGVPLRIRYAIAQTDSSISLTLMISDEPFDATGVKLTGAQVVFDWTPGERAVHCRLARTETGFEGDCADAKRESLHLTMELPDRPRPKPRERPTRSFPPAPAPAGRRSCRLLSPVPSTDGQSGATIAVITGTSEGVAERRAAPRRQHQAEPAGQRARGQAWQIHASRRGWMLRPSTSTSRSSSSAIHGPPSQVSRQTSVSRPT